MIALAVASQKGGVGKTTVCLNLAHALARRGWNTLLVDTDPQGGVGLSLSRTTRHRRGFFDFLAGTAEARQYILPTRLPEFSILPVGQSDALEMLDSRTLDIAPARIRELLRQLDLLRYDCIVLDTAAGLTGMTESVVRASDFVMIPQQAEPLAVRSLPLLMETLARFRAEGSPTRMAGILLTMLQQDHEASIQVAREIEQMLPPHFLLTPSIPRDPLFLEASALGLPVSLVRKNPPHAALIFDQIAAQLEQRTGLAMHKDNTFSHATLLD